MLTFSYITFFLKKYLVNDFININFKIKYSLRKFVIYNASQSVGYSGVLILLLKPILNKMLLVSFGFLYQSVDFAS